MTERETSEGASRCLYKTDTLEGGKVYECQCVREEGHEGYHDFEMAYEGVAAPTMNAAPSEDAKQLYEIAKAIEVGWDTSQWKRPAIPEELRAIANRLPGKPALPLPEQRGMTPKEAEGQK